LGQRLRNWLEPPLGRPLMDTSGHSTGQRGLAGISRQVVARTHWRVVLANGLQTVVGADGHAGCGTVAEDGTRAVGANFSVQVDTEVGNAVVPNQHLAEHESEAIMTTILIIVVLFLLLGGGGYYGYRRR
jgi:hypothetical protein